MEEEMNRHRRLVLEETDVEGKANLLRESLGVGVRDEMLE